MWFSTEEHLPIHRRLFAFVRYSLPRNVSVESVLKSGVLCIPQQLLSSSVAVWASAVLGGHATSRWQTFMSFLAVHKYYLTTTHHDSTCARRPKRQNQGACEKMGSNNEEREWKEMLGAQFTVAEVWMTDRNRYDMIWQTQDMTITSGSFFFKGNFRGCRRNSARLTQLWKCVGRRKPRFFFETGLAPCPHLRVHFEVKPCSDTYWHLCWKCG